MNATPTVNTPPFPAPNTDGLAARAAVQNEVHELNTQLLNLQTPEAVNARTITQKEGTK